MQRAPLDGIPPTAVTMPTRRQAVLARMLALCALFVFAAFAPAQQTGSPPPPEPSGDAGAATRSVPEPDTLVLFLAGASLLVLYHVQKRRRGERRARTV